MSTFEQELADHERMLDNLPPVRKSPCAECPWRKESIPGFLGPYDAEKWSEMAHSEAPIACHMTIDFVEEGQGAWDDPKIRQCAGAAIFRTNTFKKPRHPKIATLPRSEKVFSNSREFLAHHAQRVLRRLP